MITSYYNETELHKLGFKHLGKNLKISKKASFYGTEYITIGDNSRIDDFCILSGKIKIGSFVHISAYCALYGSKGIEMKDYSGVSANSIIYSATDDFSGNYMVGPELPTRLTNVTGGKVIIEKFVQIGASNVIFPNIIISIGASTGAMTLVNKNLDEWTIYVGIPARPLKQRNNNILILEDKIKKYEQTI